MQINIRRSYELIEKLKCVSRERVLYTVLFAAVAVIMLIAHIVTAGHLSGVEMHVISTIRFFYI